MAKSAIIQISGKQFQVSVGDKLITDKVETKENDQIKVTDVLLVTDGDKVQIGQPLVEKASVTLVAKEQKRDPKVRVFKYKSKSKYRKTMNHRQEKTVFEVAAIS